MYEVKTEDVNEDFSIDKEIFDFSNYSTKSKYYDNPNKLVIGKMKDETRGTAIEEFVRLKTKMYSFLVDNAIEEFVGLKRKMYSFSGDNIEHKKAKGMNKNVVATISHNEYKYVLLKKYILFDQHQVLVVYLNLLQLTYNFL